MYVMLGSRPDLAFALGYLSRYQDAASDIHWTYLKRVLRYLRGTIDYELTYKRRKEPVLSAFVDADWANDVDERKSTSGYLIQAFGNTIHWSSKKQPIVSLSSTEAEYIAACSAATELIWFSKMFKNMKINLSLPMLLYEDNQGCIQVASNPETKRSKHIDVRYHFLRELVWNGRVALKKIASENQLADGLTKALGNIKFNRYQRAIGLNCGGVLESEAGFRAPS